MKRALILLCPLALLVAAGCDEATLGSLSSDVQALVSSVDSSKAYLTAQDYTLGGDQVQNQLNYRHDYGGSNGSGSSGNGSGGNGGGGNGTGDQLRLRDGSCDDGG